ncbi:hypothetical protein CC80DRAFT_521488 [Byssothecium circinans]|uniref:NYN domain-containing protein n=1 Tax=Byssothecium circinans TaxID=147558 RepID=A0A6A5UHQ3_9PLEO|nr:hypothetical protein CC80DRAFT_521488 [Byssothecium circinans]
MPSQPLDTGWGFGPVLELIGSEVDVASPPPPESSLALAPLSQPKTLKGKTSARSLHLGNFGKLFAELGIANDQEPEPVSPVEPELEDISSSDDGGLAAMFTALTHDVKADRAAAQTPSPKKNTESAGEQDFINGLARFFSPSKNDVKKPKRDAARSVSPKKKSVGVTYPKAPTHESLPAQDTDTPKSPSDDPSSPMPPGLTKTQRKKWRRKERNKVEQKEEEAAVQPKQGVIKMPKREKAMRAFESPMVSGTPTLRTHHMQTRAQSRSNVSAKIHPVTYDKFEIEDVQTPSTPFTAKPAVPLQLASTIHDRQVAPLPPSTLAQPSTPKTPKPKAVHSGQGFSSVTPSVCIAKPQYTTVGTPVPTSYFPSTPPVVPTAYYTPQASSSAIHGHGLIPRTVQRVVVERPQQPAISSQQTNPVQRPQQPLVLSQQAQFPVILPQPSRTPSRSAGPAGPLTIRPKVHRNCHFFNHLMFNFPEEVPWLVSPMQLCNERSTTKGIHVFVDASNIMIGFRLIMKRYLVAPFEISFDSLALLMERRRPVAKRVFAGSHREADPEDHVRKLHEISKAVGYENNVKEQVYIRREETERKKFFKDVERMGFHKAVERSELRRTGNSSGSDSETGPGAVSTPLSAPKWVEQGVDELLHLKMCQSIIDTEVPTTMVLATGDGAEAEHSDGFLAQVERALKKGWKVELVSWRQQTNGGYKNKRFRAKWGDRFRIIELDDYLEGLIDTP